MNFAIVGINVWRILPLIVFSFGVAIGFGFGYTYSYASGYADGLYDGEYENFDEIWRSGYADGFVSGYEESIYWYPVYSHDVFVYYYNNSVWNWKNGTSAEDRFSELKNKYYERRK